MAAWLADQHCFAQLADTCTVMNITPSTQTFSFLDACSDSSYLKYSVSKMKRPNFVGVSKIGKLILQVSCLLLDFKLTPKFLEYLTGHHLGNTNGSHVEVY
jgi:hypothetical protein